VTGTIACAGSRYCRMIFNPGAPSGTSSFFAMLPTMEQVETICATVPTCRP
jgi:hypothetical protein